jgi:hypothetical protein
MTEPVTKREERERVSIRIEEVEISWLPVSESAFLLWVLVLLIALWLGIGAALGLVHPW